MFQDVARNLRVTFSFVSNENQNDLHYAASYFCGTADELQLLTLKSDSLINRLTVLELSDTIQWRSDSETP